VDFGSIEKLGSLGVRKRLTVIFRMRSNVFEKRIAS
jgi:hypothetical protein